MAKTGSYLNSLYAQKGRGVLANTFYEKMVTKRAELDAANQKMTPAGWSQTSASQATNPASPPASPQAAQPQQPVNQDKPVADREIKESPNKKRRSSTFLGIDSLKKNLLGQ